MLSCSTTQSPVACGLLDSADGVRVSDTQKPPQLMADVDVYPESNECGQQGNTSCYDATYKPVAHAMPLDAWETGESAGSSSVTAHVDQFLNWMDANGAAGYYAWVRDTWG